MSDAAIEFPDLTDPDELQAFIELQKTMTANWVEGAHRTGDAEAVFAQRRDAYLFRWREALAFVKPGASVLDIGGGYPFPKLFEQMAAAGVARYSALDIDAEAIAATRPMVAASPLQAGDFAIGPNDILPFADASRDLVFSSHSLEHSRDVAATFAEIKRILKPGGHLFYAVPIGFDEGLEHLYFADADDWIAMTAASGLTVKMSHIGCVYPETGYDVCVVAQA